MKKLPICLLFGLLQLTCFSQKSIERAQNALNASEYTNAIELFKIAYNKLDDDPELKSEIAFKTGSCYRKISKSDHAELWFAKCIELGYKDAIAHLYYADALRMNEKYEDAIEQYEEYLKNDSKNYVAQKGLASCKVAQKWTRKPTPYKVVNAAWLNSEASDYSPMWASDEHDKIIISSCREESMGDAIHGGSGQKFADIFIANKKSNGGWETPTNFGESLNTTNEEGAVCFDKDKKTIYFTRCEYSKRKNHTCKIYSAKKGENGFENPELINICTNKKDSALYAHPSLSNDGLKLYFTSDRQGGFGNYDIWYSERTTVDDEWGEPQNAGKEINTTADEMYPYIREDGILYFSSNGHHGMGGFDLYRVNKGTKGNNEIVNLMFPLNSPSDDFGIVFEKGLERGYFSSNRKGSKGYDDIWAFSLPPLFYSVEGIVVVEANRQPMANTKVKLLSSKGTTLETTTDAQGRFKFDLEPGANFILMASQQGYLNGKYKVSTEGLEESKKFEATIEMVAIDIPIEIPNIMYDFGKWTLRPESIVALEHLLEVLEDNPSIIIEISAHSDFRGSEQVNLDVSQKRAQSVVDFLILRGIDKERLQAKGYGSSKPKVADKKSQQQYNFIKAGTILNRKYIESLPNDKQEAAHQLNRRTEIKVLSTDYKN